MANPARAYRPDALLAKGTYRGYPWEVMRAGLPGYRCGYIRVPPDHPWYGVEGTRILAHAYGGVDFAEADTERGGWWLGFHTMHGMDMPDPELYRAGDDLQAEAEFMHKVLSEHGGGRIRDTAFVIGQCERLIRQADDVASGRESAEETIVDDLSLPQMIRLLGRTIEAKHNLKGLELDYCIR